MISKKVVCFTLLFYIFPVAGCLKLIDLTKKPTLSFAERKLQYEQDVEVIKKTLHERRNTRHITGFTSSGTIFLYSLYTAKTGTDFGNALMAKGERYIELYAKEQVEECSAISIVTLAEDVSFAEKKKFIQKLVGGIHYDHHDRHDESNYVTKYKFTPTLKDKEFAFFAKYKEFAPSVIQEIYPKICLIHHINTKLQNLLDVRNYIEALLFLLQLEEKESLL